MSGWTWCVSDAAEKTVCDQMTAILTTVEATGAHRHSGYISNAHIRDHDSVISGWFSIL
jgi:hypothetical protein